MILKTLTLDFVNMAGSDTYLESVVIMNRIKFMLYFNYSFESQFTLVHVLYQCCLNSTLRFSIENTSITILIFQSVYSLFYWQSMCLMCIQISLICLCKCVLSLDCSFNQMGLLKVYQYVVVIYTPHSELIYLYTYIKIGDTEGTHELYVNFIEIRSESCNYTFIDLEFQNFNI